MKLGIAQMLVTASLLQNMKTAEKSIRALRDDGAQVIALPEMFCCPYDNESFCRFAQCEGGEVHTAMREMARQYGVYLIAGSMPEQEDGRIYNTSFVFSSEGKQIARHRKIHLFDVNIAGGQRFMESDTLSPGNQVTVFETPYAKIGLCICFDIRFPELARSMVLQGAELIVVPAAFNQTTGPLHWELLFRARAVDNQVFTAGIAPAQDKHASYVSYGHSVVASPWGTVIRSAGTEPETWVQELDFEEVRRVRRELPLLSARREDVYIGGRACDA